MHTIEYSQSEFLHKILLDHLIYGSQITLCLPNNLNNILFTLARDLVVDRLNIVEQIS